MGKAALDLPDPLKHGGKPAGKSSGGLGAPKDIGLGATDDLLSQLAGNEIDRLLAEAEVEGASPGDASNEVEPMEMTAPAAEVEVAAELAQVEQTSTPEVTEVTEVAPPTAEAILEEEPVAQEVDLNASPIDSAQGEVGAELDELFAELKSPKLKFTEVGESEPEPEPELEPEVAEVPAIEPVAASTAETIAPVAASAVKTEDSSAAVAAELEADEKLHQKGKKAEVPATVAAPAVPSATAGVGGTVVSATPVPVHAAAPKVAPAPSVPAWLRPLEMINAPFNSLPEAWRNALGQVAIVTMVNAVAVLLYVWIFRGKH